jgi:hypothetical protein
VETAFLFKFGIVELFLCEICRRWIEAPKIAVHAKIYFDNSIETSTLHENNTSEPINAIIKQHVLTVAEHCYYSNASALPPF